MKRLLWAAACGLAMVLSGFVSAENASPETSGDSVTIGVLTDMSGVYKAVTGPGSVLAAKMAISDFGGTVLGKPIKLVSADHQNKADVGSTIARQWVDQKGVNLITGLGNSAVGLAVQRLASQKDTITINVGAGTSALTGGQCSRYGIHYAFDTYALPAGTAAAIVKNGGDTWFFVTADYELGQSFQKNTTAIVEKLGGKVVGSVRVPLGTTDFASYLIQAKASGAKVVALANAGEDFVNSVKQANAFGIVQSGQQLAGLIVFINDIKAIGLKTAQGLQFTTAFYWDRTDASRKWSKRFFEKHGAMPSMDQAGVYSAVMTYLKAVKKAGTDQADAVRKVLGETTINDMFVEGGKILPNGLMLHDMFLAKVKTPAESKGPWDLVKVISTIPGKDAFIPLAQSGCPLLGK